MVEKSTEIVLRDGRILKYTIDGPEFARADPMKIYESSLPVIVALHGMYLCAKSMHQNCKGNESAPTNYVVIAIQRPGYHGSSNVDIGTYTYTDFAGDVEELANHLQITKFGVIGHSSGGPNTLACAAVLGPSRVTAFATLGSDPEYTHFSSEYKPDWFLDFFVGKVLPPMCQVLMPWKKCANGLRNDYFLERQPYPFQTENIRQPSIVVIAENDTVLDRALTVRVHERLPNSELIIIPDVGHNQLFGDTTIDMACQKVIQLGQL